MKYTVVWNALHLQGYAINAAGMQWKISDGVDLILTHAPMDHLHFVISVYMPSAVYTAVPHTALGY